MPIEVRYDERRKILDISVSGEPTLDEIASTFETITNSKEYPPKINTIWDIRKADLSAFDTDIFKHIIELRSQFKERSKIKSALIVTTDLQHAFSRAIQIHAETKIPQEIMVFNEYSEGERFVLEDQLA